MDKYKTLLDQQLSEREVMIYLLISNGMSYRDLADKLGMSHGWVQQTFEKAKDKLGV